MHHCFATCNQGNTAARGALVAHHVGQEHTGFPGFAAQAVGQNQRLIAKGAGGGSGGGAQLAHAAGNLGFYVVQRFGRFLLQQGQHLIRHGQVVFLHDLLGLRTGRTIRVSGAGGNHIQRIAKNIRKHDGNHMGRGTQLGKTAALYAGKALAEGVDLYNIRPADQQVVGEFFQIRGGDERLFKQSGTAAGKQEQHGVLCGQPADEVQRLLGGGKAVLVRDGVPGFPDGKVGDGAFAVVVLGNDNTGINAGTQNAAGGVGHLPGTLAGGNQHNAPGTEIASFQRFADGLVRLSGGDGGLNDGVSVLAEFRHRDHTLFCFVCWFFNFCYNM